MRKYNGVDYYLDDINRTLKLSKKLHNQLLSKDTKKFFKKITGSFITASIYKNTAKTEFQLFCELCKLEPPIFSKQHLRASSILKKLLFEFLQKHTSYKLEKCKRSELQYFYDSENEPEIAGTPDAVDKTKKVAFKFVITDIENLELWKNTHIPSEITVIPEFYAYLLGYSQYIVVVLGLNKQQYRQPRKLVITKSNLYKQCFNVHRNHMSINMSSLFYLYKKHTKSGISPRYEINYDSDLVEYLRCRNEYEWKQLFEEWKAQGKIGKRQRFWKYK